VQPLTLKIREKGGASERPPALDKPKHGKEDEKNEPHVCTCSASCVILCCMCECLLCMLQVGGSQWAGGTGGSNTAGLGGRGGPYRLDKGHAVHQVSQTSAHMYTLANACTFYEYPLLFKLSSQFNRAACGVLCVIPSACVRECV
jgi:hypothetical protein